MEEIQSGEIIAVSAMIEVPKVGPITGPKTPPDSPKIPRKSPIIAGLNPLKPQRTG